MYQQDKQNAPAVQCACGELLISMATVPLPQIVGVRSGLSVGLAILKGKQLKDPQFSGALQQFPSRACGGFLGMGTCLMCCRQGVRLWGPLTT